METSKLFAINQRDFLHGLVIAAGTAAFTIIEGSISNGVLSINWKQAGLAAVAGGLTYIGKKFFTPAKPLANETK